MKGKPMTELEAMRDEMKSLRDEVARLRAELAMRPPAPLVWQPPIIIREPYYPPSWAPTIAYTTCDTNSNTATSLVGKT